MPDKAPIEIEAEDVEYEEETYFQEEETRSEQPYVGETDEGEEE